MKRVIAARRVRRDLPELGERGRLVVFCPQGPVGPQGPGGTARPCLDLRACWTSGLPAPTARDGRDGTGGTAIIGGGTGKCAVNSKLSTTPR